MPQFTWLTFTQAKAQLAQRLADTGTSRFWTDAECGVYIKWSLRAWNSLTEMFNADFSFTADPSKTWYDLSLLPNSPRIRTVTDAEIYTFMQYMLLEPPTGAATWTGTAQFTLADLQNALQRRRDELIQFSGCNLAELELAVNTGSRRVFFPDNVLEPRRVRYIPVVGDPNTLNLEDTAAMQYFEDDYPNQAAGNPELWSVVTGPPLAMDTDDPPLPGQFHTIVLESGLSFAPPAVTLLGLPDDWCWLAAFGAMADLLSMETEATDYLRAGYFMQRYSEGMKAMAKANWLVQAQINAQTVDTVSMAELDCYSADWEIDPDQWPMVVSAGTDFVAAPPLDQVNGVKVTLVGNAPVPVADGDFVQVSRDEWDVIMGYAHFLATVKMGGGEFVASLPLEKQFYDAASVQNKRLAQQALYWTTFRTEGLRQDITQPRR